MTETTLNQKSLFDQMTKVQHRVYGPMVTGFLNALDEDPYFVSRALVYLYKNSKVRDQQDCAIIALLQSPTDYGLRDAGAALLAQDFSQTQNTDGMLSLPPYRLLRVWDYIHGNEIVLQNGKQKRVKRQTAGPKVHSRMRNLMTKYVGFLESEPNRFDGVAELNKSMLKYLYTTYGLKPSKRAQAILFDNHPPSDSKAAIIKQVAQLAKDDKVIEAAILGIENKLSYMVMQSIIPKSEPAVAIALVEAMTAEQAANSISWVEKSGILEIPEVKNAFTSKVKRAKNLANLSHRKSSQATNEAVVEAVKAAKETVVSGLKKIERETLVLIDISASMTKAIPVAVNMTSHLAPYLDFDKTMLVWFKHMAGEIKPRSLSYEDLVDSVKLLRATGGTSMVAGLNVSRDKGFDAQNIVVITDGGENGSAASHMGAMATEVSRMNPIPQIIIVGVGSYDRNFTRSFDNLGISVEEFIFEKDDYYLYDQVGALLAGARRKTLVESILEIELPYIERFLI